MYWFKSIHPFIQPFVNFSNIFILTDFLFRYMGSNIPGKPREMLLYLGGVHTYIEKCRAALEEWTGFVLTPSDELRASL